VKTRFSGVPAGVPGELVEVVLRPHQSGFAEQLPDPPQRARPVANVVVGDHDELVGGAPQAGDDAVDLPHRIVEVGVRP
jgi:hypothetical protein